ncbi:MAG TPA: AraC family transcriptional regulator [Armatimonadota bacterium]|jgi:AraC-like DNA-binding protein
MGDALTPRWPNWVEMVAACRHILPAIAEIHLPDHRLHLLDVRPYRMPRGWRITPHAHSFYEASIILDGHALDDTDGEAQTLSAGQVIYHAPHVPHTWSAPDQTCLRLVLWYNVDPPLPVPRPARWPHLPELLSDIACLFRETRMLTPGWRDKSAARLAAILATILALGELPALPDGASHAEESLVQHLDRFLLDNLERDLSLADIAACIGASTSSLAHRYKQLTGYTVGQRRITLRLEHAAELLVQTPLSLGEICARVGIGDPAYLCRLFQRYFHTTPGQYRLAWDGGRRPDLTAP